MGEPGSSLGSKKGSRKRTRARKPAVKTPRSPIPPRHADQHAAPRGGDAAVSTPDSDTEAVDEKHDVVSSSSSAVSW